MRSETPLNPNADMMTAEQKRDLLKRLLRRELELERYPLSYNQRRPLVPPPPGAGVGQLQCGDRHTCCTAA